MAAPHSHGRASPRVLHALLQDSRADDPRDEPIAPLGEHGYTTLTQVIPSAVAVLRVAARIEPDPRCLLDWYRHTHIAEMGHLTAEQLVDMGRAPVVIAFLRAIHAGARG